MRVHALVYCAFILEHCAIKSFEYNYYQQPVLKPCTCCFSSRLNLEINWTWRAWAMGKATCIICLLTTCPRFSSCALSFAVDVHPVHDRLIELYSFTSWWIYIIHLSKCKKHSSMTAAWWYNFMDFCMLCFMIQTGEFICFKLQALSLWFLGCWQE